MCSPCMEAQAPMTSPGRHLKVAKLLLEVGADKDAQDNEEWSQRHRDACNGHLNVAKLLLEAGPNRDTRDNKEWTRLLLAARA